MIKINTKQNKSSGFTLIEMIVALSIFTVVMTVALGSLLSVISANKKSQAIQSLMTNLNFAIDDISRNARVGTTYHCSPLGSSAKKDKPRNCSSGGDLFAFEATDGDSSDDSDQVVYKFNDTTNAIEKSTDSGANYVRITEDRITIENLEFYVLGASNTDKNQPRVVIVVRGVAGTQSGIMTDFNIETMVTQRSLDI